MLFFTTLGKVVRSLLQVFGRMHFIRFGIRDRIIRLFDNPGKNRNESFTIPFFGQRYPGNFNTFIDWSVYYYGAYAIHELIFIREIAAFRPACFVDIGANVGHHSLFASMYFDNVISIEPYEVVYTKLKEKMVCNHKHNISLLTHGLGQEEKTLTFFPPQTGNTGTGSFVTEKNEGIALTLQVRRGDEVLYEQQVPGQTVIKIDTEGFEPEVLAGMARFIAEKKPILFFEWSQNELKPARNAQLNDLLPDSYLCFQFLSHIPYLFFLERQSFALRRLNGSWPDGMILAFDAENMNDEAFRKFIQRREVVSPG